MYYWSHIHLARKRAAFAALNNWRLNACLVPSVMECGLDTTLNQQPQKSNPKTRKPPKGAAAIVQAYYPQTSGAAAIASVLVGDQPFTGKLATTWPKQWNCTQPGKCQVLPGRFLGSQMTYRYGAENVLYPFGYGLSYTTFSYSGLALNGHAQGYAGKQAALRPCDTLNLTVTVANTGTADSSEVVQVYLQWDAAAAAAAGTPTPMLQLVDFVKVRVPAGEKVVVALSISPRQFAVLSGASTNSSIFLDPLPSTRPSVGSDIGIGINSSIVTGSQSSGSSAKPAMPVWVVVPQTFAVWVGGQQPALAGAATGVRAPSNVLQSSFTVKGTASTPVDVCGTGSPS